jgi:hypothetical protein
MRDYADGSVVAHLLACRNVTGAIAARHLARAGVPPRITQIGTTTRSSDDS